MNTIVAHIPVPVKCHNLYVQWHLPRVEFDSMCNKYSLEPREVERENGTSFLVAHMTLQGYDIVLYESNFPTTAVAVSR